MNGSKILYGKFPHLKVTFVYKLEYASKYSCTNVYKILVITTIADIIANAENMTALPSSYIHANDKIYCWLYDYYWSFGTMIWKQQKLAKILGRNW